MLVGITCQVIVENIESETHSYGLQYCKKDHDSRHALKTKLYFKSFWKYLRQIFCAGILLL